MSETDDRPGPFAGVRILDFTRFQQGPYATRLFADLGATVLKIERPGGEWDRRLRLAPDGFGGFFYGLNRGKHSVAVDITTEQGRQIILRLAAECDVVIENFRPGVMDRLRIGYEDLRAVNEQLIFAAGTGYGPHGPSSGEPMFDMVAQAVSGVSDFNQCPGRNPTTGHAGLRRRRGRGVPGSGHRQRPVRQSSARHRANEWTLPAGRRLVWVCTPRRSPLRCTSRSLFRPQRRVTSTSGALPLPRRPLAGHRGNRSEAVVDPVRGT